MGSPKRAAAGDPRRRHLEGRHRDPLRWRWALSHVVVALNVPLLVVLVASLDAALIAMAGGVSAHLIMMLCQGWIARREAGRGQPCMHARALR